MENKEFAVFRLFGLDFTSRKFYRRRLAMQQSSINALIEANKESELEIQRKVSDATAKLNVADEALLAAIEDYNRLREQLDEVRIRYSGLENEFKHLKSAYEQAKRELAKRHSKRGSNGRFVKKDNPK